MAPSRRTVLRLAGGGGLAALAGCRSPAPDPTVSVPSTALTDEVVAVEVTGLDAGRRVTFRSSTSSRDGTEWVARATFEAAPDGTVAVPERRPVDGRYYDRVAPMGPFWAMRPAGADPEEPLPPPVRFVPPGDAYDVALVVEVDGTAVAEATTTRRLFDPRIERLRVRRDDLVGDVFLPPGDGVVPGVVHLHGAGGEPHRWVGRLLASRGFAALALHYFGEPAPLPESLREVPVGYVDRALDWFRSHERVDGRLGLFGFSRGGPLALLAAARAAEVDGVVGWVPSSVVYEGLGPDRTPAGTSAWSIRGEPVPYLELAEPEREPPPTPGLPYFEPPLETAGSDRLEAATVPVGAVDAPIYLVSVTDDRRWPSTRLSERAIDRLDAADHPHPYRHDAHEGAGHLVYPPYLPTAGTMRTERDVYGGSPAANARANADAWSRTLSFLETSLGRP